MNTSIAPDCSNDSSDMSPALTRENSQDVDDNVAKTADLLAKYKTVTLSGSLAHSLILNSEEVIHTEEESENVDLSKFATTYSSRKAKGSSLKYDSVSKFDRAPLNTNGNHETDVRFTDKEEMTPGINPADIGAENGVPHTSQCAVTPSEVNTDDNMTSNIAILAHCSKQSCVTEGIMSVESSTPLPQEQIAVDKQLTIPEMTELTDQHHGIATQTAAVIRRIRHLQSLVATRHTRQQLMTFVEHQRKMSMAHSDHAGPSTSHSVLTMSNATTEDLNSMSTTALVEWVQRMHGTNKNTDKKPKEKRKRQTYTMRMLDKKRVQETTGVLSSKIKRLHESIDSDATASSSGGETDDEDLERFSKSVSEGIGNDTDSNTSANLRHSACWKWSRDRALVISRWTWLQAQVSDLEYRIRQHGELHRQLRTSKSTLIAGPVPTQTASDDLTMRAARCMPLPSLASTRHKVVRVSHAPTLGQKARRPVMVRCRCVQPVRQCAICAGHHHYAQPMDIHNLPRPDRIGQIDSGFHPVLSFSRDANLALELEEVVNSTERSHSSLAATTDKKMLRLNKKLLAEAVKKQKLALRLKKAKDKKERKELNRKRKLEEAEIAAGKKKKSNNKKRKNPAKRERTESEPWELEDEDDEEQMEDEYAESSLTQSAPASELISKSGLQSTSTNKRAAHYDIDDIVIPYHIAAATRVEKLQVKEIDTPRWRECTLNGMKSVHGDASRRSSSMSVPPTPQTPMTPAASESKLSSLAPLTIQTGDTESQSTPDVDDSLPIAPPTPMSGEGGSLSARSSGTTLSLTGVEMVEDISDVKYIALHDDLEVKEKSRYMNFVTAPRARIRTTSTAYNTTSTPHNKLSDKTSLASPAGSMASPTTVPNQQHTSTTSSLPSQSHKHNSTNSPMASPATPAITNSDSVQQTLTNVPVTPTPSGTDISKEAKSTHTPLSQSSSIPLSSSHDASHLREELASSSSAARKRSSSFTANRLKKDQSLEVMEKPVVQPWSVRRFPLAGDDEAALDSDWVPPLKSTSTADTSHQWKVITAEQEETEKRSALVLKLSKAH